MSDVDQLVPPVLSFTCRDCGKDVTVFCPSDNAPVCCMCRFMDAHVRPEDREELEAMLDRFRGENHGAE